MGAGKKNSREDIVGTVSFMLKSVTEVQFDCQRLATNPAEVQKELEEVRVRLTDVQEKLRTNFPAAARKGAADLSEFSHGKFKKWDKQPASRIARHMKDEHRYVGTVAKRLAREI